VEAPAQVSYTHPPKWIWMGPPVSSSTFHPTAVLSAVTIVVSKPCPYICGLPATSPAGTMPEPTALHEPESPASVGGQVGPGTVMSAGLYLKIR
jgi:hypothetical protein